MTFPYVQSPDKLVEFLKKIPNVGVPPKLNNDFLKSIGYSSSNDRSFVSVAKSIGLADGSGSPTDLWKEARTNLGTAIAKGVMAGYGGLYQTYPNAHQQSNEAIKNYFKANSPVGDAAISKMVSTFKAFVGIGNFTDVAGGTDIKPNTVDSPLPSDGPVINKAVQSASGLTLNLNIELQVPSDPTGEVYDKFFSAMKKHLIDAK